MLKKLREPVNSLTHWAGALLALGGLIALLIIGWDTPAKIISLAIYGVSLIAMFSASATYHMVRVKDRALEIFRKLDHAAIYLPIAGTYTPFGLERALQKIPVIRERFWKLVRVPGVVAEFNQNLEKAGRVADYLEFGELMCLDALTRDESCGGHFREEHQTPDGEAKRNDRDFSHVSVWEHKGDGVAPTLHKEPLRFEYVHLATRVYI